MVIQLINIGTSANDGTGDSPRARCIKINNMFQELYAYFSNNTKKRFLATPTAADGVPVFREIVEDDLPNISASKISDLPTGLTLSQVYPVGSIYTSTSATNPNTLFGFGTWERFGNGRCLVGVSEGEGEFATVTQAGGAKTHTHVVSGVTSLSGQQGMGTMGSYSPIPPAVGNHGHTFSVTSGWSSGLPPYITVYFWRRAA